MTDPDDELLYNLLSVRIPIKNKQIKRWPYYKIELF